MSVCVGVEVQVPIYTSGRISTCQSTPVVESPNANRHQWSNLQIPIATSGRISKCQSPPVVENPLPMVPPLAYFAIRGELANDQDDKIGLVPPLAYFASGGNYPMITT